MWRMRNGKECNPSTQFSHQHSHKSFSSSLEFDIEYLSSASQSTMVEKLGHKKKMRRGCTIPSKCVSIDCVIYITTRRRTPRYTYISSQRPARNVTSPNSDYLKPSSSSPLSSSLIFNGLSGVGITPKGSIGICAPVRL